MKSGTEPDPGREECCFLLLFLPKNPPMNQSKKENSLVYAYRLFISLTRLAVGKH